MRTYTWRDPFAGHVTEMGDTLSEAIEIAYRDIEPTERPAYVWVDGQRVSAPDGQCVPVQ